MNSAVGTLTWISGPVAHAHVTGDLAILEQVWVGDQRLAGEIIALDHGLATIQIYEETTGCAPANRFHGSGQPPSVKAMGLLGNIFDGIQRPLLAMQKASGIYVQRGIQVDPLPAHLAFYPVQQVGDKVSGGTPGCRPRDAAN
ncbi:MAG: hypothetical protein R2911_05660 [Caldilineaceae bacterium]